jgi:hypothetical protein
MNRALFFAAFAPAVLGLACANKTQPTVGSAKSAVVTAHTLQLTVTSVTRGDEPPEEPNPVFLLFSNFNVPQSRAGDTFGLMPGEVSLGTCDGNPDPFHTCPGLTLPQDSWTTAYTVDTDQPKTISIAGEIIIQTVGQFAPTFSRFFHIGLDVNTNFLHPISVQEDGNDTVTCNGSTCTANISIGGGVGPDRTPWTVTMAIAPAANVTVPYVVQNILYNPPFDRSSTNYGSSSTLGTTTSWQMTDTTSLSVSGKKIFMNGGLKFTSSDINGASMVTQTVDSTGDGIKRSDNFCLDPNSVCDPSVDPDHSSDTFIILFGVPGILQSGAADPSRRALTIDYSAGLSRRFTVRELRGALQTPLDESVFCNNGICDTEDKPEIVRNYLTPADAQQILNMDPYVSGIAIDQHPERFEPACEVAGTCTTPESLSVSYANPDEQIKSASHAQGNGTTSTFGSSTGVEATVNLLGATLGLTTTYRDMTTQSNFTSLTASVTLDNLSHCEEGSIDLWLDKAFGSFLWVPHLQNICGSCSTPATQFCTLDSGGKFCTPTSWGFEPNESLSLGNSAETSSQVSTDQAHSGSHSLMVSASSDPMLPASINMEPCTGTDVGTMNVQGRTYSAWIFVPDTGSSFADTNCRLRAFGSSFQESQLSPSATVAPIVPASWFQISATFPSTALESQIYETTVECKLPGDWVYGTNVWYIDDIQIN